MSVFYFPKRQRDCKPFLFLSTTLFASLRTGNLFFVLHRPLELKSSWVWICPGRSIQYVTWHPIPYGRMTLTLGGSVFCAYVSNWMGIILVILFHWGIPSSPLPRTPLWRGLWLRVYKWCHMSINSQSLVIEHLSFAFSVTASVVVAKRVFLCSRGLWFI